MCWALWVRLCGWGHYFTFDKRDDFIFSVPLGFVKEPFLLCAECALRSAEGNIGEGMCCELFSYLLLWLFRFPQCGSKIEPGEREREREGEMPVTASLLWSALALPLFFHSNSWIACVYMCLCAWVSPIANLLQQTVHSWANISLEILTNRWETKKVSDKIKMKMHK